MVKQTGLGSQQVRRVPGYVHTSMGRVIDNSKYEKYGIIEVVFIDTSSPFPIWVIGDIDRKPMTGDEVIVGYIDGRKDAPYLAGFVKNKSYTTNFFEVDEKHIRIQIPVMEIAKKDGKAHNDVKKNLQEKDKLKERAYVELKGDTVKVYHPSGQDETGNGAYVELSEKHAKLYHPAGTSALGEGAYAEIKEDHVMLYHPSKAFFKITESGIEIFHPSGNVTVNVPGGILDVK